MLITNQSPLDEISNALDRGSWNWLLANDAGLASAIENAASSQNYSPEQIKTHVMMYMADTDRGNAIAARCEQAARHVLRQQVAG